MRVENRGRRLLGALGLLSVLGATAVAEPERLDEGMEGGRSLEIVSGESHHLLRVELAVTRSERERGLMDRPSLEGDAGMLFVYRHEQPADAGFWMFRTRIPLDIAFLDARGAVLAIEQMEPCPAAVAWACPTYAPGVPYSAALEVNRGYFQARGIGIGDRVRWAAKDTARQE